MIIKIKSLKTVAVILCILFAVAGCNKSNPAGAPYDIPPTPGTELRAEITLTDNHIPAQGVLIQVISSGNVTTSGTTDVSGLAKITIYGYGNHRIIIPNDTAHGFTTPIEYSLNATANVTQKIIDRGTQTIAMSLDPLYTNSFGSGATNIIYNVSYKTDTPKKYTLLVNGLPTGTSWQFVPPFVQNAGDTSILTITTPKYLKIGKYYNYLTFTASGDDGTGTPFPAGDTIAGYALYQNWGFDFIGVSVSDTANITQVINGAGVEIGRTFQFSNLQNFPTNIPLKVSVSNTEFQAWVPAWDATVPFDIFCRSTMTFNVGSNIMTYAINWPSVMIINDTYNTFFYSSAKICVKGAYPLASPYPAWVWMHVPVRFSNDDGFSYTVYCGTDY